VYGGIYECQCGGSDMYGSFEIPKDIVFEAEVNEQGQASPVVA
jgi:hypothetical protein